MMGPKEAQKLAETISRIEKSVTSISQLISRTLDKGKKDIVDTNTEVKKGLETATQSAKEFRKDIEDTVQLWTSGATDLASSYNMAFDSVKSKLVEIERLPAMKFLTGNTEKAGFLSGKKGFGIVDGIEAVRDSVMSGLPAGGFLGLLMFGVSSEEKLRVDAAKISSVMLSTSRDAMGAVDSVKARLQALKGVISAEEIGASVGALAQSGFRRNEIMGQTPGVAKGQFGGTIAEMALASDKLFTLAQGTSAKIIGETSADTGDMLDKVTVRYVALGKAVQNSGANVGVFQGMLAQAASALRLQRQDTDGLAQAYLGLADSIRKSNPTASAQYVAKSAQSAFNEITGALPSLDRGYKNYLMNQMGIGSSENPIKNIYEYDTGMQGKDPKMILKTLDAMVKDSKKTGEAPENMYNYLMNGAPHMQSGAARALIEYDSKTQAGISEDKALAEMAESAKQALNVAGDQKNQFEVLAEKIQTFIGALGEVFVASIGGVIRVIVALGTSINYALSHFAATASGIDKNAGKLFAMTAEDSATRTLSAINRAATALKGVSDATGGAMSAAIGPMPPLNIKDVPQYVKDAEQKKGLNPSAIVDAVEGSLETLKSFASLFGGDEVTRLLNPLVGFQEYQKAQLQAQLQAEKQATDESVKAARARRQSGIDANDREIGNASGNGLTTEGQAALLTMPGTDMSMNVEHIIKYTLVNNTTAVEKVRSN